MSCRLSTAICAVSRQTICRHAVRPPATRTYASQHGASKPSEIPLLAGSISVTVVGLAYLLSGVSSGSGHDEFEIHRGDTLTHGSNNHGTSAKGESRNVDKDKKPDSYRKGNPKAAHKSSQTGQMVPPPPSDNSSGSVNWEEKKRDHEEYKKIIEKKDTKAATRSSDLPSKKLASEHPRDDPQRGEGEARKKGDSKSSKDV